MRMTDTPVFAACIAAIIPAGPPPTTTTSQLISFFVFLVSISCSLLHFGLLVHCSLIMPIPKIGDVKYKVKKSSAGLGLFAAEPIKRGTWIIEYVGKIISGKKEVEDYPENKYLFETSATRMIDGSARSNTARYINHSCKPNCEVDIIGGRVFVKAVKRIEAGEELNYDYGEEYTDEYIKPYGCRCVSCKGKNI